MSKKPDNKPSTAKRYTALDQSLLNWLDGATVIISPIRPGAKGPGRKPKKQPDQDNLDQDRKECQ